MAYETPGEIKERVQKQMRSVVAHCSKYGWQKDADAFIPYAVNINNAVLNPAFNCFKQINKIHGGPSDEERVMWEDGVIELLERRFRAVYHREINIRELAALNGKIFPEIQLEEMVAAMEPEEIIKKLYGGIK